MLQKNTFKTLSMFDFVCILNSLYTNHKHTPHSSGSVHLSSKLTRKENNKV